jgi:hypothetical protein
MKRIIVTEEQLREYVEKKKAEKIFNAILEDMHLNSKKLNENISITKANQTVVENYKRKKLLTPKVRKMLEEYNLFEENTDTL